MVSSIRMLTVGVLSIAVALLDDVRFETEWPYDAMKLQE